MSWHTSGMLIHADFTDDYPRLLKILGLRAEPLEEDRVSFEDATSSSMEGLGIGVVDGWTCLFSSFALMLVEENGVAKIAKKADVFSMMLEGSSGAAGFEWWSRGKKIRERMVVAGEIITDNGKPLRQEKQVFINEEDDEQRVLLLMEKLTVPIERLVQVSFSVYSCDV